MRSLILASLLVLTLVVSLGYRLMTATEAAPAGGEFPWSYSAIAAIPTDDAIQNDLFDKKIGVLLFKEGNTGNAAFFCPVTHLHGRFIQALQLTYRDGDGKEASGGTVTATLKRARRSNGRIENILSVKSDGPGSAGNSGPSGWSTRTTFVRGGPRFEHEIDLLNFYYYVQINLKRTSAAIPVGALGVQLE